MACKGDDDLLNGKESNMGNVTQPQMENITFEMPLTAKPRSQTILMGPPPPRQSKGKNVEANTEEARQINQGGKESDKDRRKRMRDLFIHLQALVPHLPERVEKSSVVAEAVNCIEALKHKLRNLEKHKWERDQELRFALPVRREKSLADQVEAWATAGDPVGVALPELPKCINTMTSPNVVVSICCGGDAHINVCSVRKPSVLLFVIEVLEKHEVEVVTANVSSEGERSLCMVHARIKGMLFNQFTGLQLEIEDIYKLAAEAMLPWLSY